MKNRRAFLAIDCWAKVRTHLREPRGTTARGHGLPIHPLGLDYRLLARRLRRSPSCEQRWRRRPSASAASLLAPAGEHPFTHTFFSNLRPPPPAPISNSPSCKQRWRRRPSASSASSLPVVVRD